MKANEIAELVLTNIVAARDKGIAAAMNVGLDTLYKEHEARLDFSAGVLPGQISILRQMFTQWKAAVAIFVSDSRWPFAPIGFREKTTAEGIEAFPEFFARLNSRAFFEMYENNVFLGWNPSVNARGRIDQLRWTYKNMTHADKGLAYTVDPNRAYQPQRRRR